MAATPYSFEALRNELASIAVPVGETRQLIWVVPGRLGAAVAAGGAFEIFLLGPRMHAELPLVAGNLLHDQWKPSAGGAAFDASRVLLGRAGHFAAVAALIASELARLDLSDDEAAQRAFTAVEPIIELAIRRAALSNEIILGLIAELHVLRVVLVAVPAVQRPILLHSWRGWAPGRDFVIGGHGVEIKATVGATSRHVFSGIHQLEVQPLKGRAEKLHLLSLGLQPVESGGPSLPELIDDLLALLEDGTSQSLSSQTQLLEMIASYGGPNSPNYDHGSMHGWSVYQQRYAITFARLYDVADPDMRLLDRNLIEQTFVVPESVRFELAVPSIVSAFNPAENWQQEIAAMARL